MGALSTSLRGSMADYNLTCAMDAFKNHLDAFGAQDIEKIMLDYTEDSEIMGHTFNDGNSWTKKGLEEIRGMFTGFWEAVGEWKDISSPVEQISDDHPGYRIGFLTWQAPGNGIPQATDTFIYDENFKIIRQTFAGGVRPADE